MSPSITEAAAIQSTPGSVSLKRGTDDELHANTSRLPLKKEKERATESAPASASIGSGTDNQLPINTSRLPSRKGQERNSESQQPGSIQANAGNGDGESKLSGAELKKRQKEEKAARRQREKQEKTAAASRGAANAQGITNTTANRHSHTQDAPGRKERREQQPTQSNGPQVPLSSHHRTDSSANAQRPVNLTHRPAKPLARSAARPEAREIPLFSHLTGTLRRHHISSPVPAPASIHPAILALGLQISSYTICGSSARCAATLLAVKAVIRSYIIPPGQSFSLHFNKFQLPPQIDYLKSCRPLSISQGSAIRWLKIEVGHVDPSTPEATAKYDLCAAIDTFIRERITVAGRAIASTAASKISKNDVILVFGKSSIIQQTLLNAQRLGTKFRVVVVDSRPLFEGRNLARFLASQGIEVQYLLITAAAHAVAEATKCFLGAHAMLSNGRLYSRVGTALVAMLAAERDLPVIVCCESIKFTDKVALDSIVNNEVAPPDELLEPDGWKSVGNEGSAKEENSLETWHQVPNLQLLNIMYDVTPAEYIKMVITEYGSLPPSSVPVVHRISTDLQGKGMI